MGVLKKTFFFQHFFFSSRQRVSVALNETFFGRFSPFSVLREFEIAISSSKLRERCRSTMQHIPLICVLIVYFSPNHLFTHPTDQDPNTPYPKHQQTRTDRGALLVGKHVPIMGRIWIIWGYTCAGDTLLTHLQAFLDQSRTEFVPMMHSARIARGRTFMYHDACTDQLGMICADDA